MSEVKKYEDSTMQLLPHLDAMLNNTPVTLTGGTLEDSELLLSEHGPHQTPEHNNIYIQRIGIDGTVDLYLELIDVIMYDVSIADIIIPD